MNGEFLAMLLDHQMLKSAFGNSLKVGPVEVIDPKKGYRLKLGETADGPFLSPWYPHPETGKTSIPLKKGQIVGVINPSGDPRQGMILRGGYSGAHPSPNDDMAANVFEDAGVKITVADGALVLSVGASLSVSAPTASSSRADRNATMARTSVQVTSMAECCQAAAEPTYRQTDLEKERSTTMTKQASSTEKARPVANDGEKSDYRVKPGVDWVAGQRVSRDRTVRLTDAEALYDRSLGRISQAGAPLPEDWPKASGTDGRG